MQRIEVPFEPEYSRVVDQIAVKICREFFGVLSAEDLAQSLYLWLLEKPARADRWIYTPKPSVDTPDPVETFGWLGLRRDCASVMAKAARAERALLGGYDESDSYAYSKGQVKQMIVWCYANPAYATGGERPERSQPQDAALGFNFECSVVDVRIAFNKVIREGSIWSEVAWLVYGVGLTHEEAAERLSISRQLVTKHAGRLIDAILFELNGTESWRPSDDGPGTRQVRSNASAQALTNREHE